MGDEGGVAAVDRALSILDAFAESDPKLSLAEIAKRTGLYKSTVLRLIKSLEKFGYMHRSDDGAYQLGSKTLFLGSLYQRHFRTADVVPAVLRQVVDQLKEGASLYVRDGDYRVCLHRIDSTHAVRYAVHEGDRLPLTVGASSHVIRAFNGAAARATSRFVATCTPRRTANAIRKPRRSHAPSSARRKSWSGRSPSQDRSIGSNRSVSSASSRCCSSTPSI